MNVLVTGARGFIGRNLSVGLELVDGVRVEGTDHASAPQALGEALSRADLVFHLAGVNRPDDPVEFERGNADLTGSLCNRLIELGRATPIVFASSVQVGLNNPYGASKRAAEERLARYAGHTGARCAIYRLSNVFGKWCRPNYNSVVATFCHNIARDLPITISDPTRALELVYVDDIVATWRGELRAPATGGLAHCKVDPRVEVTLGELAEHLRGFRRLRDTLLLPSFERAFTRKLYATYLSYLPLDSFAYTLEKRYDDRGCLAEFMKSAHAGQIFVSRTEPGITRGNHYHHSKTEKFLVLDGQAVVRFRQIQGTEVLEYPVRGEDLRVIDIPPGYTHAIENVGRTQLVTLFWASEIFDPERPDTCAQPVR